MFFLLFQNTLSSTLQSTGEIFNPLLDIKTYQFFHDALEYYVHQDNYWILRLRTVFFLFKEMK